MLSDVRQLFGKQGGESRAGPGRWCRCVNIFMDFTVIFPFSRLDSGSESGSLRSPRMALILNNARAKGSLHSAFAVWRWWDRPGREAADRAMAAVLYWTCGTWGDQSQRDFNGWVSLRAHTGDLACPVFEHPNTSLPESSAVSSDVNLPVSKAVTGCGIHQQTRLGLEIVLRGLL